MTKFKKSETQILEKLKKALAEAEEEKINDLVEKSLKARIDPKDIIETMSAGMGILGEKFAVAEVFVPEVLAVATAMKDSAAKLEPYLKKENIKKIYARIMVKGGELYELTSELQTSYSPV